MGCKGCSCVHTERDWGNDDLEVIDFQEDRAEHAASLPTNESLRFCAYQEPCLRAKSRQVLQSGVPKRLSGDTLD